MTLALSVDAESSKARRENATPKGGLWVSEKNAKSSISAAVEKCLRVGRRLRMQPVLTYPAGLP